MSGDDHVRFYERLGVQLPRATPLILCFQYREDAERVLAVLTKRFAKYGLTLHPEKTRLLAFGRSALPRHPNAPKPATLDFLGFTHLCARSRRGRFAIHVRTIRKRLRRSVKAVAHWCQHHSSCPRTCCSQDPTERAQARAGSTQALLGSRLSVSAHWAE
jgi:hypothetical protein